MIKKSVPGHTGLNAVLMKRRLEIEQIIIHLRLSNAEVTIDAVREEYRKRTAPAEVIQKQVKNFLEYWDLFLQHHVTVNLIAEGTVKQYGATRKQIAAFQEYSGRTLTLEDIDTNFGDQFKFFLFNKKCSNNTVGGRIKHIKVLMNWAVENKFTSNQEFKRIRKPSNRTDIIALTQAQLDKMFTIDLSSEPRLQKAQHLFILAATTGLRYSDVIRVAPAHIKGNVIVLTTKKNDKALKIPLNDYSKSILEMYPDGLPKLSNPVINRYLKEVGIRCKFFEEVEISKYKMGIRTQQKVPLYSLITVHTGRRSFISQSLMRGLRPHEVMAISGHSTFGAFQRYLHASDQQLMNSVANAWNTAPVQEPSKSANPQENTED
jgi:site-specific recombinase XerD